ncbi:hypothetical protein [Schleiferilactobacillus harbinensis]|uniref:hypothetical protein n=1 Tax=Schleiferilactobacillus harbinensis TaxID=304207 RepID=UPI000AC6529E|nr:hypothetical protein [Schleiferilactobacillus harbinensis]
MNNQGSRIFNPTGVQSKMKRSAATNNQFRLADGATFDNGYIQTTGNVPIAAQIAESESAIDGMLAGNWGVMVRVKVADGIDARSLAAAIDWDKSYYYLTVDSAQVSFGIPLLSIKKEIPDLNFPLQFDHHVYLDPKDTHVFFLKVKGIPYGFNQVSSNKAQMFLPRSNADYLDYLHNRNISSSGARTLDKINGDQQPTTLNDTQLIDRNRANQPQFFVSTEKDNAIWNPFHGALDEMVNDFSVDFIKNALKTVFKWFTSSPVYSLGDLGRTASLLNAAKPAVDRQLTITEGVWDMIGDIPKKWFIDPILTGIAQRFMKTPFRGRARINFSFDMSQYKGSTEPIKAAFTKGRLPAAPYADGEFNRGTGTGSLAKNDPNRAPIEITMFDSSQLVDPYAVTRDMSRTELNSGSPLRRQLQPGTTPMDYAVIKEDQLGEGTKYNVYSNFTSWTGAIVPYDRHYHENNGSSDTLHSNGKITPGFSRRTATPDPGRDGVLVNNSASQEVPIYPIGDLKGFMNGLLPKPNEKKAGVIAPSRYANVFTYYDYDNPSSAPVPVSDEAGPKQIYVDQHSGLAVKVTNPKGVNVQTNSQGKDVMTRPLDGEVWHYEGTLNGLPLADATVQLRQPLTPTIDLSTPRYIWLNRSEVKAPRKRETNVGTWRDPLGDYTENKLTGQISSTLAQQDVVSSSFNAPGTTHSIAANWADDNPQGDPNKPGQFSVDKDKKAKMYYQMPPQKAPKSTFFRGKVKVQRTQAIETSADITIPTTVAGTAEDYYLVLLNNDTPDEMWYTMKKSFVETGDPTIHFMDGKETKFSIAATVDPNGKGVGKYPQNLMLYIPKVKGTKLTNVRVAAPTGMTVKAVPVTVQPNQLSAITDYFDTYQLTFNRAVDKPFSYTYEYEVTKATDIPRDEPFQDMLMSDTQALAISNGLTFDDLKAVNLHHVPSLDFKKQPAPGSNGAIYALPAESLEESYFQVRDNDQSIGKTPHSWTLTAAMSPFVAIGAQDRNDFRIHWGGPSVTKTGPVEGKPDGYHNPTDRTVFPAGNPAPNDFWNYYNHQAAYVTANDTPTVCYTLDRLTEPDAQAADLIRYYPEAKLQVPTGTGVVQDTQYKATITYTLTTPDSTLN